MAVYLLQLVAWTAVIAVLLLWPAGTLAYPGAWAFIALFGVGGLAMILWLGKYSPSLLRERMSPPLQRDQEPWDRIWLALFAVGFFAWLVFTSWDAARTGFTAVPAWLQALGGVAIALYMLGAWWTFRENAFAAPVVKIQSGQRVIDSGPYSIVRHPMYASALLLLVGIPLLLGSWIGLLLSGAFVLGIAWRAVHEEQTLAAKLLGYRDYAARVRYRLVPYVW
ncbi:MAG TPA: isoprenylcysteine carboxylmethyltransferase family protein [Rhizobiaceae bacterium]|nr:isoprenylcysteine carboxylmethyltransferase family protein [Rhizobiaceae bacterium]